VGKNNQNCFLMGTITKGGRKQVSCLQTVKNTRYFLLNHIFAISDLKHFQKFFMTSLQNSVLTIYSDEENQHTVPGNIIFLLAELMLVQARLFFSLSMKLR